PGIPGDAGADARGSQADAARRDHREAPRRAVRLAAHRDVAEDQVRAAPGVRRLRLQRSQRRARRDRQPFSGHLRTGRPDLRRQRRHRLGCAHRARPARATRRARDRRADARRCAGRTGPLVAALRGRRALGPARARDRGDVSRMDSGRPCSPRGLRRRAFRQAGARGAARDRRAGRAVPTPSAAPTTSIKVTNPERVIDPSSGITKVTLVRYYESVAERILPHLRDRPLSLVRAPDGIAGTLFFQKHPETRIPGVRELTLWPGEPPWLGVDTPDALVSAAQMNTVEFHTGNSTVKKIDQPDRIVFDLDPGEGVGWPQVQQAAVLMRALLDELGLASWLKTSGGKGLHVVVPVVPKLDYDPVKDFSAAVVTHLAKTVPQRFVAKSGGSNRLGR